MPKYISWTKIGAIWAAIITIVSTIGGVTAYIYNMVDNVAKETVNVHDHGYASPKIGDSHSDICFRISKLEKQITDLEKKEDVDYKDLYEIYWQLIGYLAANAEANKNLKVAASSFYRRQFEIEMSKYCNNEQCREEKKYLREAFRTALGTRWLDRDNFSP